MNESVWRTSFEESLDALSDPEGRELLSTLVDGGPGDQAPESAVVPRASGGRNGIVDGVDDDYLQTLVEYGFVEWNVEAHRVERGPNFREIAPLLELFEEYDIEPPDDWL